MIIFIIGVFIFFATLTFVNLSNGDGFIEAMLAAAKFMLIMFGFIVSLMCMAWPFIVTKVS